MKGIIALIQARTGSTRLPSKVLLKLGDKTVLDRVIERVKQARLIGEVIIATTFSTDDSAIVKIALKNKLRVFCGSQNDVLDRYYQAAKLLQSDHIVRVMADCPLIDPGIIDRVIDKHLKEKNDYTACAYKQTFPDGLDMEALTFRTLEKVWKKARLAHQREHVTLFITSNPHLFKIGNLESEVDLSDKRWVLDEPADYQLIKAIYQQFRHREAEFRYPDVLQFLEQNPDLENINRHIQRNRVLLEALRKEDNPSEDDG